MSVRSMLAKSKVEFVGTTDDPTDDLKSHRQFKEEETNLTVSPSFRPDTGLNIDKETFLPWVEKLAQAADLPIDNYAAFLTALESRVDFFDEHGCKSSDHGISVMFYEEATKDDVAAVFQDRKSTRLNSSHVAISYAVFCLNNKISRLWHRFRGRTASEFAA